MKTIAHIHPAPASVILFAAESPSGKEPGKEKKIPVEPLSEKDEVKNAEEKTRNAQEKVDNKKKQSKQEPGK